MRYLVIDTSTKFLCVALCQDGRVLRSYNRLQERAHSQLLIVTIDKVLRKCNYSIDDIDFIAVCQGPGSFTGIRIGLAAVKGLSLVSHKPVVGFCSLEALAYNLRNENATIYPIIDAKRGQVYSAAYTISNGVIKKTAEYCLSPIEDLMKKINSRVIFTGDAIALFRDIIKAQLNKHALFAKEEFWYPKVSALAKLGIDLYNKKSACSAEKLAPLYLYTDTCTVNKSKVSATKHGGPAKFYGGKSQNSKVENKKAHERR
ncbi:MAG: tRNA (adenosine(37)-N6)-threonylcarbamoyltransferase complex dimerization subunit type 1 TsaB [Candidatus Omnitrophota bacterium]